MADIRDENQGYDEQYPAEETRDQDLHRAMEDDALEDDIR